MAGKCFIKRLSFFLLIAGFATVAAGQCSSDHGFTSCGLSGFGHDFDYHEGRASLEDIFRANLVMWLEGGPSLGGDPSLDLGLTSLDNSGWAGGWGGSNGFMPGEFRIPLPPLPGPDREALIALMTGDWRALLDSAISAESQQLWSMVPNPMIMDADDPRAYGPDPGAVANSMKQYVKAQTSNCYNGFHQTTFGKAVQAFSALALFPVASNYQNNDLLLGSEILGKFSLAAGSKSAGNVFAPLLGEFTSTVTTPLYALGTEADAGALSLCGAGAATSIHP